MLSIGLGFMGANDRRNPRTIDTPTHLTSKGTRMMAAQPDRLVEALLEGPLTAPVYEALLARADAAGALDLVARCALSLDARERHHHEAAESLARLAARHLPPDRGAVHAWLDALTSTRGATAEWVAARVASAVGDHPAALRAWDAVIEHAVGPRPARYLARGRQRLDAGDPAGAAADLREALRDPCSHDDMERGHKLWKRLQRHPLPALRKARIALLGSFTTRLIKPLLELAAFRDGVAAEVYEAEYGMVHQEVLDPASGLRAFRPDVVILATSWRDANLPPLSADPAAAVESAVAPLVALWRVIRDEMRAHAVQHNFDVPLVDSYGHLGASLPGGRGRVLRRANQALLDAAGTGVSVLDFDSVAAEFGKAAWSDEGLWYRAKQHPAPAAIPLLVDHYMAHVRAVLGLTKKVLVLDLDNTLWGGIVGEDGVEGLKLGVTDAEGEAHTDLQRYARELRDRGVVLAVCSKNNEADAKEPFERSAEMVLKLDDIAVFRANWSDKATNIRDIAAALELGTDSFVFLDDNPTERAWVRSQLPEVMVPEIGSDAARYLALLHRHHAFDALALSEEDRLRAADYAANARRSELMKSAGDLEEFIANLQMSATVAPVDELNLPRAAQLVNKSNQFNLTTRRYTEEQLRAESQRPDAVVRTFKLRDRFADNGLIGVMIGREHPEESTLEIDTWLMSCRVLGRRVEEFMVGVMMQAALDRGLSRVLGRYLPTAKNALVKDLYPRLGFTPIEATGAPGETAWEYRLDLRPVLANRFIRVE
jgi:FkbH-like protein